MGTAAGVVAGGATGRVVVPVVAGAGAVRVDELVGAVAVAGRAVGTTADGTGRGGVAVVLGVAVVADGAVRGAEVAVGAAAGRLAGGVAAGGAPFSIRVRSELGADWAEALSAISRAAVAA